MLARRTAYERESLEHLHCVAEDGFCLSCAVGSALNEALGQALQVVARAPRKPHPISHRLRLARFAVLRTTVKT